MDEANESFVVRLVKPVDVELLDNEGQATILDDDPTLSISDVTVVEGDAGTVEAVFTVALSAAARDTVAVRYTTVDGTGTAEEDYTPVSGRLVFEPTHPLEQTIVVPVLGDTLDELDETFLLSLFDSDYAPIARASGEATIRDDDPQISVDDMTILEGDSGPSELVFTVSLSETPAHTVTVDYATANGTATAGEDYAAQSGTLTFVAGGPTEQTITVAASGDTVNETNETFFLNLSNASNASIVDSQGAGTLLGDDGPSLSIGDVALVEGASGTAYAQFTVSLSEAVGETVQVNYTTSDGSARAGSDYNSAMGTLIFSVGGTLEQTFLVPILGDALHEGDETFHVDLFDATVVAIADSHAVGTIIGDDPVLSIDDVSIVEGDSGNPLMQFTVSISQDPLSVVTVDFATEDDVASAGIDYLSANGSLTFSPGGPTTQTIDVRLISDTANETHETFTVALSNATGTAAAPYAKEEGVATILDDDGAKLVIDEIVILTEGDTGTADATFTVTLTEPHSETVTVDFSTTDGTAISGLDFQAVSGTLTFLPGQPLSQTVTVPVLGDLIDELDESFTVELSGAPGIPRCRPSGNRVHHRRRHGNAFD